ncbi:MAG: sugar transferase [Verrucomicrobiota bacterium]
MILVHSKINRLILQTVDGVVAAGAFLAAFYIRTGILEPLMPGVFPDLGTINNYLFFIPIILIATPIILFHLGYYNMAFSQRLGHVLNTTFQAGLILFIGMVILQFMLKIQMSRMVFVIFVPTFAIMILCREMIHRHLRMQRTRHSANLRNMVVVTDGNEQNHWKKRIQERPEYGFQVCKTLSMCEFSKNRLIDVLHHHSVQLVVFDIKSGDISIAVEGIRACEEEGIETWFSTGFFDTHIAEPKIDLFGNQTFLIFRTTPDSSWGLFLKYVIDRIGALGLLVAMSPVFLAIALLIRFTSKGPVFFKQKRSGHYGHPFVMYKFRSMVTNAEQQKDELRTLNEMSGPVFKVTNDPRVTPLGTWLRKTSLDELPQLINVLIGDMSLVGPRPLPIDETLAISENAQRRRLSVKPGITCLWQICGRNEVDSFDKWVELDLQYIDSWSPWLDIKILLKTLPAVVAAKGAK